MNFVNLEYFLHDILNRSGKWTFGLQCLFVVSNELRNYLRSTWLNRSLLFDNFKGFCLSIIVGVEKIGSKIFHMIVGLIC